MPGIANTSNIDIRAAVTAALDWWRDAGIDHAFVDDPQDWLAAARAVPEAAPLPPMKPLRELMAQRPDSPQIETVSPREGWPQTPDTFPAWWLAEPALAPAGLPRLSPTGPANAPLMVLVPIPAADDHDGLLTGRGGKLLDAMFAAMGVDRTRTYLASALPAHVPMPDWTLLQKAGLGDVLLHHITLAAPKKLLILGASGISALLGHDPTNLAQSLRGINQERGLIAAMPAWDLEAMLARPALKAGLWARWLDWTGTEQQ
ncbi:hypothetical protein OVA07_12750 [Novosphingobium sp. SL115]|uniref:hypothetical protein n=1 Tax=Novosphingobium sp. SL115 TaxID=2995150 RepID=UPI0022732CEB|nr:hypothetical protein [Novosphingobium sp. SL115]MCY1671871.1 hypothetical protein [Novosphingobium sp. SL115]